MTTTNNTDDAPSYKYGTKKKESKLPYVLAAMIVLIFAAVFGYGQYEKQQRKEAFVAFMERQSEQCIVDVITASIPPGYYLSTSTRTETTYKGKPAIEVKEYIRNNRTQDTEVRTILIDADKLTRILD